MQITFMFFIISFIRNTFFPPDKWEWIAPTLILFIAYDMFPPSVFNELNKSRKRRQLNIETEWLKLIKRSNQSSKTFSFGN